MVDLVGEPGNIHGPDSTINGGFISSIPSPFQIPHLKDSNSYLDDSSCQILDSNHSCDLIEDNLYSGMPHVHALKNCFILLNASKCLGIRLKA